MPIIQGCVEKTPVSILRDTWCSGIVVRRDLVRDDQLTGEKRILVTINRSANTEPIASFTYVLWRGRGTMYH